MFLPLQFARSFSFFLSAVSSHLRTVWIATSHSYQRNHALSYVNCAHSNFFDPCKKDGRLKSSYRLNGRFRTPAYEKAYDSLCKLFVSFGK